MVYQREKKSNRMHEFTVLLKGFRTLCNKIDSFFDGGLMSLDVAVIAPYTN